MSERATFAVLAGLPGLVALALLASLGVGCGPSAPPADLDELRDGIVFAEPLRVAPGSRWSLEGELLGFRNRGALAVPIADSTSAEASATETHPLELVFEPAASTSDQRFEVWWNEEVLTETLGAGDDGLFRLEIAAERIVGGEHVLELRRKYHAETPDARSRHESQFTAVRYRLGEHESALSPAGWNVAERIGAFLLSGVIADPTEPGLLHGGLLFVDEAERSVDAPAGSTLRLVARNLSEHEALFRVQGADSFEARLAPGDRHMFRTAVDEDPVTLSVESLARDEDTAEEAAPRPEGLYLWSRAGVESAAVERPPIVVITLDTTRRDALGVYGAAAGLTPNLDAFAGEATVFDHAFATAPWTLPSHASLFTGLYPSRHGAGVSRVRLPHSPTLARLLRSAGYGTAGISAGQLSSSDFGVAQGFELFRDPDRWQTPGRRVAQYAETFLDELQDAPFFLWINYFDPHALYEAPEPFQEQLGFPALRDRVEDAPLWERFFDGDIKAWRAILEGESNTSPAALAAIRAAYLAEIAHTDALVGELFESLRRRGLYERSLIVVTADHGELLGEGGYFSHGARLDPELMEIPLLVKWPQGRGRDGKTPVTPLTPVTPARDDRVVSLVDLYPTVLRAAGLEPPASDGFDLGRPDPPRRRYVVLEEHEALVHPLPPYMEIANHVFGVQRRDDRRVVWAEGQSCQERDGETWASRECTADPADVLRLLRDELGREPASEDDGGPEVDPSQIPEDQRKALEALGYI